MFLELYRNCYEVYLDNKTLPGIYTLQTGPHTTIHVNCMEDGWTVLQSQGQFPGYPKYFFNRGWKDYVNGFGIPGKEFGFYRKLATKTNFSRKATLAWT